MPDIILSSSTTAFFVLERVRPGRGLPKSPGWYTRALLINGCQIVLTLLGNKGWNRVFVGEPSVLHLSALNAPLLEGFAGWLVGTHRDATDFTPACGFPRQNERRLARMLVFQDAYNAT